MTSGGRRGARLLGGLVALAFAAAAWATWTSDPWPERVWVLAPRSPPTPDGTRARAEFVGATGDAWSDVAGSRYFGRWVIQPGAPGVVARALAALGIPGFPRRAPATYHESGLRIAASEQLWLECFRDPDDRPPPPAPEDVAGTWDVTRADGVARRVTLAPDGGVAGWHGGMRWTRSGRYVTIGFARDAGDRSDDSDAAPLHDAVQFNLSEDGRTCDGIDDGGRGVRATRVGDD